MTQAQLIIRAATLADAEALTAINGLPGVRHGTLALPFPTVEATRKRHESFPKTDMHIVAERAGAVIGSATLNRYPGRRAHCATIGVIVHDDHQGQGVGTALFAALIDTADRWLGLLRLELEVNCDNAAGLALYRRFGFFIEARLIGDVFRDGAYVDGYKMARLAGSLADRAPAADAAPDGGA